MKGSQVAAINPQLDISHYTYANQVARITKSDFEKVDRYHRNDLSYLISQSPETKFLLIINGEARHDIEVQLKYLLSNLDFKQGLNYGLSRIGNIAIWIYDGPGKQPHNVQENYRIYSYIRFLLESMDEENFVNKHQHEVLYINDWWRYQAMVIDQRKYLEAEQRASNALINRLYQKNLGDFFDRPETFYEEMTARVGIVNHSNAKSDTCNDLEWIRISDETAKIIRKENYSNKNGKEYELLSDQGEVTFGFKCIGDGTLEIRLRGPFKKEENGNEIPMCIDYTGFMINGETIFQNTHSVWHKKPFSYILEVKDAELIRCSVTWQEHRY